LYRSQKVTEAAEIFKRLRK
jgi:tetratricopeptide (TPR) repeat protein